MESLHEISVFIKSIHKRIFYTSRSFLRTEISIFCIKNKLFLFISLFKIYVTSLLVILHLAEVIYREHVTVPHFSIIPCISRLCKVFFGIATTPFKLTSSICKICVDWLQFIECYYPFSSINVSSANVAMVTSSVLGRSLV